MKHLGQYGAIFRTHAGKFYTRSGQAVSGLPKGFSDILFVGNDGIACFVEAKVKPNKPEREQIAFIEKMRGLGCRAGFAYTVDDALTICEIEPDRIRQFEGLNMTK